MRRRDQIYDPVEDRRRMSSSGRGREEKVSEGDNKKNELSLLWSESRDRGEGIRDTFRGAGGETTGSEGETVSGRESNRGKRLSGIIDERSDRERGGCASTSGAVCETIWSGGSDPIFKE